MCFGTKVLRDEVEVRRRGFFVGRGVLRSRIAARSDEAFAEWRALDLGALLAEADAT